jgi:hypothetical protein
VYACPKRKGLLSNDEMKALARVACKVHMAAHVDNAKLKLFGVVGWRAQVTVAHI